jgi:hypothetical protein
VSQEGPACATGLALRRPALTCATLAVYQELAATTATAPRKSRILSFMSATKKLFASVLCSGVVSVLVACHSDRPESFYASLADVRKAEASAQSWIPDDILPASSRTIHVVGQLSPSKEWCAFEFLPADSESLLKDLKSFDALPPSVKYVGSPRVSWWPSVLEGNLDVEKIRNAGFQLFVLERPAKSVNVGIYLFALDSSKGVSVRF